MPTAPSADVPPVPSVRIPEVDVLGVRVSALDRPRACAEIGRWIAEGERHYVCVTGVHGVMESQQDPALLTIHNASGLTVPDGMPLVWMSKRAGVEDVTRVYGPDLMLDLLALAVDKGWSSFFYGGKDGIPELLAQRLQERFPGLKVAGTYSPPFRPLTDAEDADVVAMINGSGADLVWVGLSTPKQEKWMASHRAKLDAAALLGVGAAFDFHAGQLRQAPAFLQEHGLEWAFRLAVEPRRLWRRYLSNNPRFLWAISRRPPVLLEQKTAGR